MRIIGITGPSGAGKTRLTEYVSSLGIPTINADELYHSMLVPPSECLDAIKAKFGDAVFANDGTLDRKALSEIVFSDSEKLRMLNETVLSIVVNEIKRIIKAFEQSGEQTVAVDAPTLIESGFDRECDVVVSVICPEKERAVRISLRDQISKDKALSRIHAQKDDSFYTEHSNYVINNNGTEAEFDEKIREFVQKLGITTKSPERKKNK